MTTNAGAISVAVQADTASFESSMDRAAASAERSMARTAKAQQTAEKAADKLEQSVRYQIDTFNLSGTALLRYQAQLTGASDRLNPMIDRLERMKDAQAAFNTQAENAGKGAASMSRGMAEAGKSAEGATHATSGITRELLVLGHEASQGNWKRLGGSFLVLGELGYAAAGKVLLAWGPMIALAGAALAVGAAFVKGAMQSHEFVEGIILTGNAAGLTAGLMDSMAVSVGHSAMVSATAARSIIQELAKTGEVGPRAIAPMAEAVARVARLSGESSESVAKEFAKMGDNVIKFAIEHNKQYNSLSFPQLEYIRSLQEQGKVEEAETEYLRLLNEGMTGLTPKLTGMAARWHELGEAAGQAWDILAGKGRTETIEDKIAAGERALEDAKRRAQATSLAGGGWMVGAPMRGAGPTQDSGVGAAAIELQMLQTTKAYKEAQAAQDALTAAQHKGGAAASEYFAKMNEEAKGATRLDKDLLELKDKIAKRVADGGPETDPQDAKIEAFIRHRDRSFSDKAGAKLDSEFTTRLTALEAEGIKLDRETQSFTLYGKAIDKSRQAMLELELAQGKLRELSPAQKNQLLAAAGKDDAKDKLLEEAKAREAANKSIEQHIEKLRSESSFQQLNARDTALAAGLALIESKAKERGTEATVESREELRKWIGVKYDELLVRKQLEEQATTDAFVRKLDEETAALGQSTLVLQQQAAARALYNASLKDIVANPGKEAQIIADRTRRTEQETDAIKRNYEAKRSSDAGIAISLQKYQEEAANAASFSEKAMTGGLKQVEDALVSFAKTGKLSLSSLFNFMYEEFLRNWIKMQIAQQTSGSGSSGGGIASIIGAIGGFFGGGSSGLSTADYSSSGFATGTNSNYGNEGRTRASGGPVEGGKSYLVGERGPEVLRMGNAAGAITPNGASSGGGHVEINIANHGAPVEAQETGRQQSGDRTVVSLMLKAVASDVRNGGQVHSALAAQYGLSRAAGAAKRA